VPRKGCSANFACIGFSEVRIAPVRWYRALGPGPSVSGT
jgi:hypothetical protein